MKRGSIARVRVLRALVNLALLAPLVALVCLGVVIALDREEAAARVSKFSVDNSVNRLFFTVSDSLDIDHYS